MIPRPLSIFFQFKYQWQSWLSTQVPDAATISLFAGDVGGRSIHSVGKYTKTNKGSREKKSKGKCTNPAGIRGELTEVSPYITSYVNP